MTYWDSIVAILAAITSPAAVVVYLFLSIPAAIVTLFMAVFEHGFWSNKRPYRWRKPTWCRVVFVAVGPYILLASAAISWIGSMPSGHTWP